MKTFLVTGCAGFIGFHTTRTLLARGDKVIGVDNLNPYYSTKLKEDRLEQLKKSPQFSFFQENIADQKAVAKIVSSEKIDAVCHLAAQAGVRYSIENPYAYIESNLQGTTAIFEESKRAGINHIVYASSSSVYGKADSPIFVEDQSTDTPISLYAATKKSNELLAHSYHHLFGMNMMGLRFFTVFGPWGRPDMFAFLLCKSIIEKEPVKVFNEGKMYRDFTFIDDIVSGIIACLDKPMPYEIFNLGGAHTTLLNDFIDLIEQAMGETAKKEYLPLQPGDVLRTSANVDKAQKLLGWQPKVSVEQGVNAFCQWFKEYYPVLKKENVI